MPMICDQARQTLLDLDWSTLSQQPVADAFEHLRSCRSCQEAMADFGRLQLAFRSKDAAEAGAVPAGGWSAFERRLSQSVHRPNFSRVAAIGGVAAAFFITASCIGFAIRRNADLHRQTALQLRNPTATAPTSAPAPDIRSIEFTPHDVTRCVNAFDQVAGIFDGRTSWLLESDTASDMGLASAPIDQQKVLLLRLSVTKNKHDVSSADLAIVPGQTADLSLPIAGGQALHYQIGTSSDEQTRLSIWVELTTPGQRGQPIAALATSLQIKPGDKLSAGQFVTGNGAYQLDIAFAKADARAKNSSRK